MTSLFLNREPKQRKTIKKEKKDISVFKQRTLTEKNNKLRKIREKKTSLFLNKEPKLRKTISYIRN